MLSIPMHIFLVLICLVSCDQIIQIVINILIVAAWDIYYLVFYLADAERLYENRYNIIVFFNIFMISTVAWGIIIQDTNKSAFLQQLRLKSINGEFLEMLQYIPEGIMIAHIEVEESKRNESMGIALNFSKDFNQFLLNMKKVHNIDVRF